MSVQSYSAADGSSQQKYGVRCLYPTALSSTELTTSNELTVQLHVYGVHGSINTLSAAVVINAPKAALARLASTTIEVDSTEFPAPFTTEAKLLGERPDGSDKTYQFAVPMSSIPNELSIKLPDAMGFGKIVPLRPLVLRRENRYQPTGLCQ
jgi:hypothetical protein